MPICVWTCDMTSRSYFGKMNSTLGSVVPLAMFSVIISGPKVSKFILKRHQNCCFYSRRPPDNVSCLNSWPPLREYWWKHKTRLEYLKSSSNNNFPKKMFKECLLPPSYIIPSSPKLKKASASNCYPTAFSLSKPLVKNWRKTNFQKEIKTLWEEVAAANFAPLVCFPA